MVDKETNRSVHRKLDNSILRKMKTSEVLSTAEEKRAKQQVKFIQSKQEDCPPDFYAAVKIAYKSPKTKDGRTLWDSRRDTKSS